ncbi:MAG: hypothetical protein ABIJ56_12265 [Pseudomonadota bacterium]
MTFRTWMASYRDGMAISVHDRNEWTGSLRARGRTGYRPAPAIGKSRLIKFLFDFIIIVDE